MGFIVVSAATGTGSQSLGGQVNVNEVAAGVNVLATESRIAGVSPVRRVWQQSWYGLGFTPSAGPFTGIPVITWWRFQQMEAETTLIVGVQAVADTLYWDVWPGGECTFEVDWP